MGQIVLYMDRGDQKLIDKLDQTEYNKLIGENDNFSVLDGAIKIHHEVDMRTLRTIWTFDSNRVSNILEYEMKLEKVSNIIENSTSYVLKEKIVKAWLVPIPKYAFIEYIKIEEMLI